MAMSRKDYQAFVDELAWSVDHVQTLNVPGPEARMALEDLAESLAYGMAQVFKSDNSAFSYDRFAAALESAGLPVSAHFAGKS